MGGTVTLDGFLRSQLWSAASLPLACCCTGENAGATCTSSWPFSRKSLLFVIRANWRPRLPRGKSSMTLLPYGIPIAIGTISYFMWNGMLL